jgi:hypothetical protein
LPYVLLREIYNWQIKAESFYQYSILFHVTGNNKDSQLFQAYKIRNLKFLKSLVHYKKTLIVKLHPLLVYIFKKYYYNYIMMVSLILAILINPVVWYVIYALIKEIYKRNKHKQRNLLLLKKAASYEKKALSHGFIIEVKHYAEIKTDEPILNSPEYNRYSLTFRSPLDFGFYLQAAKSGKKIKTCYKEFVNDFILYSMDMTRLTALLNRKTRDLINELSWRRIKDYDELPFLVNERGIEIKAFPNDNALPAIIETMIELAKEITRPGSCKKMLLDNFNDKAESTAVRAANLDRLFIRYPEYKMNREIINKLKDTTAPWLEYISFKYKITDTIQSPGTLEKIFSKGELYLKLEILTFLSKTADPVYLDFLISACTINHNEILLAVISILEKIGSTRANDVLLKHLGYKDIDVLKAVIKALGRCGNVLAFGALRRIKTWKPSVRKLIKHSCSQIQSRYNLQETTLKGSLSLYEKDDSHIGDLSLSE